MHVERISVTITMHHGAQPLPTWRVPTKHQLVLVGNTASFDIPPPLTNAALLYAALDLWHHVPPNPSITRGIVALI